MQQLPSTMQQPSTAAVADAHSQQQRQRQQQRDEAEAKASGEDKHAANGSSAAAAASIPPLSTAQRFHTDGLQSVFAFLQLKELPSVALVCLAWRNALYKEPSRLVSNSRITPSQLPLLIASPLRHHQQTLDMLKHKPCSLSDVKLLQQLPSLKQLSLQLDGNAWLEAADFIGDGAAAAALLSRMFPRSLERLALKLGKCARTLKAQHLMIDVASLQSQLMELTLELVGDVVLDADVTADVSALQRLPLLTKLTLAGWPLNEEAALALASLSSLESLNVNDGEYWTAELLTLLCDPAHCKLTRLRTIYLNHSTIAAAHMQALAQLPALNDLRSWYFQPDALPLLSSLRSLTSLDVAMEDGNADTLSDFSLVVPHLAGCALLRALHLNCLFVAEADLKALVAALPQLQICSFCASQLPSLTALGEAKHLRQLVLLHCRGFHTADLLPIAAVKSLRVLQIGLSPAEHAVAQFMLSSSSHFQHLDSFKIE